ncbi:unnamed protein product [Schistosoma turkestanicum]|nr:unnamed protein product [Schistosoma turkestanicum]
MSIFENEAPSGDVTNDHNKTRTYVESHEETVISLSVSNNSNDKNSQPTSSNSHTDHSSNYFHNGPSSAANPVKPTTTTTTINIQLSIVTKSSSPKPFKYTLKLIPQSQTTNSTYVEGVYEIINDENKSSAEIANVKQSSSSNQCSSEVDENYLHLAKETCNHLVNEESNRTLNIESLPLLSHSLRTQTKVDENYLLLAKETCDHLDNEESNRSLNIESLSPPSDSLRTQTK